MKDPHPNSIDGEQVTVDEIPTLRTEPIGREFFSPRPSFQRACEREVLYYLDNPLLMSAAPAPPATPFIVVATTIQSGAIAPPSQIVVSLASHGPRFQTFGPLRVVGVDSSLKELTVQRRHDVRQVLGELGPATTAPDGAHADFEVDIVPALRRLRVYAPLPPVMASGPAASPLPQEELLLDVDLGPTIAAACASHTLPACLCDTTPPTISGSVTPDVLWPPDNKLIPVAVSLSVTDDCTPNPSVVLESISSSDPELDETQPDYVANIGTDDRTPSLRAERESLSGRVYTLTYRATDQAENVARLNLTVTVPHDMRLHPAVAEHPEARP